MALSQQDIFVFLLLGKNGYAVDIGAGNGSGEPCASNISWLEDKCGWKGILVEYNENLIKEAAKFRPNFIPVYGDAFKIDYKELFIKCNTPKVIDYLTIDIDPTANIQSPCVEALKRFLDTGYDFKILTIEHDLYNPHGPYQKNSLSSFMKDKKYKLIAENVGLAHESKNYLEDWYISPDFYNEFKIKDIDKLYYKNINPNNVILDLVNKRKNE